MKTYFGIAIILWGLATIFVLPDHPKLLNIIIMGLYVLAIGWWLRHYSVSDALYWVFATGITLVVTYGYGR